MRNTVFKTSWGYALEVALKYDLGVNIPQYSTLNEHLDVGDTLTLQATDKPIIQYLAIGSGGKTVTCNAGSPVTDYSLYRADQTHLYRHLPFIIRQEDNDLSTVEAAKYRMRKKLTISSVDYIAYYLKVIDRSSMTVDFNILTKTANGNNPSIAYNAPASIEDNTPPDQAEIDAGVNKYMNTFADVGISLTTDEVEEIKLASEIINGGTADEYITEIALVSGKDKTANMPINGANVSYQEAAKAQVNEIIRVDKSLIFGNPDLNINLSAGALNPLFG